MNEYYLCYPNRHVSWVPTAPPTDAWIRTAYFGDVFQTMEQHLQVDGLTFHLTSDYRKLPSYGDRVVAVLQEDEPARIPRYANRVLATFTCYGTHQPLRSNPLVHPTYANFLAFARHLRNVILRLPGRLRYRWHQYTKKSVSPVYTIPLGYANQEALPLKPIEERSRDVFFSGSVEHRNDSSYLRQWLGTPKYHARRRMLESLKDIKNHHPDVRIDVEVKDTFMSAVEASAETYSERMMDAKICPAPRGTSLESFRFFEALRFGCIPIVHTLPSRWYYDDAPVIRIDDWRELEDVVLHLLNRPSLLQEKHNAALEWWDEYCSEKAIGTFIAKRINQLL